MLFEEEFVLTENTRRKALFTAITLFVTLMLFCYYAILHKFQVVVIQQVIALLFSSYVYLYAGYLFNANQTVIARFPGLLALIPVFMDLKGNLEISQAARFSTISNTNEEVQGWKGQWPLIRDNIAYRQFLVTIISMMAVMITSGFVYLSNRTLVAENFIVMLALCLVTSTLCCTCRGTIMTMFYSLLGNMGQDTSNFSTALASSVGDTMTIAIISVFAGLFEKSDNVMMICWICIGFVALIFPLSIYYLAQYPDTCGRLKQIFPALIVATLISLFAGFLFESAFTPYPMIPSLSPLFNGYAGNSVSIICNVLATHLIFFGKIKSYYKKEMSTFVGVNDIFFHYVHSWRLSMVCSSHLFYICMPLQCYMILLMRIILGEAFIIVTPAITIFYSIGSFCLVSFLLFDNPEYSFKFLPPFRYS